MNSSLAPIRWLFAEPASPSAVRAILWWEKRRIPVNLLIGAYGILCLVIFFAAISYSHVLQPGEDAVEPIAIILAPIAFNVFYTFGWLVEAPSRVIAPDLSPKFGPRLLIAGLIISFCVISLPAVLWVGYVCLQLIRRH